MQINRVLFFAECNLGRKIQLGRLNEVHCIEANKIVFSYIKVYGVLVSRFPTHKRSGVLDQFAFFR